MSSGRSFRMYGGFWNASAAARLVERARAASRTNSLWLIALESYFAATPRVVPLSSVIGKALSVCCGLACTWRTMPNIGMACAHRESSRRRTRPYKPVSIRPKLLSLACPLVFYLRRTLPIPSAFYGSLRGGAVAELSRRAIAEKIPFADDLCGVRGNRRFPCRVPTHEACMDVAGLDPEVRAVVTLERL
jgi:hypothetical protein